MLLVVPNMQLDYSLTQGQFQRLKLSPQMLRDLKLLQLPLAELQLQIQSELENNPALEATITNEAESLEEYQEQYNAAQERLESEYPTLSTSREKQQEVIENTLSRSESLHEHLLWQLHLQPINEEEQKIGEALIWNLNDNGFYNTDPFDLLKVNLLKVKEVQVQSLIDMIQQFDPSGICVADVNESLLLQARSDPLCPPYVLEIIQDHLAYVQQRHVDYIVQALKISPKETHRAIEYISRLTPYPGQKFSQEPTQFAVPDITIRYHNQRFEISINERGLPKLGINRYFLRISEEALHTEDNRAESFARTYVKEARAFISSLKRRYHTLMRTTQALVKFQSEFFRKGKGYIKPLTLKDVARELNLHETTISRVTRYKYVQSDWGIHPFRYLFSHSVGAGANSVAKSRQAIKNMLSLLIKERTAQGHPIRDHILAEELVQQGVHIARRTVAKYRKELELSP